MCGAREIRRRNIESLSPSLLDQNDFQDEILCAQFGIRLANRLEFADEGDWAGEMLPDLASTCELLRA
jgi:hypothetical protein